MKVPTEIVYIIISHLYNDILIHGNYRLFHTLLFVNKCFYAHTVLLYREKLGLILGTFCREFAHTEIEIYKNPFSNPYMNLTLQQFLYAIDEVGYNSTLFNLAESKGFVQWTGFDDDFVSIAHPSKINTFYTTCELGETLVGEFPYGHYYFMQGVVEYEMPNIIFERGAIKGASCLFSFGIYFRQIQYSRNAGALQHFNLIKTIRLFEMDTDTGIYHKVHSAASVSPISFFDITDELLPQKERNLLMANSQVVI